MNEQQYYEEIEHLIKKNEISKRVRKLEENYSLIETYWHIGKIIVEAQGGSFKAKYGNELIKKWSINSQNFMEKDMMPLICVNLDSFICAIQNAPRWVSDCPGAIIGNYYP